MADTTKRKIDALEFRKAPLIDVVKVLTELTGDNIISTPNAGQVEVSIFLNNTNAHEAIENICLVNDLWYRKDDSGTYRIMTNEEYSKDLVIHKDEKNKIFTVYGPNAELIAQTIKNLYGARVYLSYSDEPNSFSTNVGSNSGSSNNNSRNNTNNNMSSLSGESINDGRSVTEELSIDQLSALELDGSGKNIVSGQQLRNLSSQRETINVTIVSEHNLVIVRTGDHDALSSITQLVDDLDKPVPQVLLEMKVIDVLLGDDFRSLFDMGVKGGGLVGNGTGTLDIRGGSSLGGSLLFSFVSDRLTANLEFLDEKKRVSVLSTPMILAANNRTAKLFVGEEVVTINGYTSENSTNTTGSNVTVNNSSITPVTSIEEVGNTIEITPFINKDGTVTLQFNQQTSSVKNNSDTIAVVSGGNLFNLPLDVISTAEVEGTVIAKDGLTFAVGGLVRETISDRDVNVPGLSNLPGLGPILTSTGNLNERSELILLITPHVMKNLDENTPNIQPRKTHYAPILFKRVQCSQACK